MSFNPGSGSLASASDVALSNPGDAQLLAYNGTTAKWTNSTAVTGNNAFTAFIVTAYGAKGDGTSDDTSAIQSAINAAGAVSAPGTLGSTVYFPAGTYKISSTLTIGSSGISFEGAGFRSSSLQQTVSGLHAFAAQDKRELAFRNLKIVGEGTGTADGIYLAASGSYAVFDCTFENLYISGFGRHGIHTEDLCTSTLAHVRVEGCGSDGFHIGDNGTSSLGGTSVSFISCYSNSCGNAGYYLDALKYSSLSGCATDTCNYGYFTNRSSGIAFTGCGAESTTGSAGHGFMIANGTTSVILDACWMTNIKATTGIGINITSNGSSSCSRIVVAACRVQGGIVPLYSAQVDSNCQALFIGFQPHPSALLQLIGKAQFLAHDNSGLSSFGQTPVSGDEPFVAWLPDSLTYGLGTSVQTDSFRRWAVRADGRTEWGSGSVARDTNLYRSAASSLRTDSTFVAANINIGSPSGAAKLYASYADSGSQTIGMQMIETAGTALGTAMQIMEASSASKRVIDIKVTGDTSRRVSLTAGGTLNLGDGTTLDTNVYRSSAGVLATDSNLAIRTAGKGLQVKEGTNAKMGTGTLTAGTVTIANTSVTATSRIFLTTYIAGGTVGALYVSAKAAGTSFSVTSTSATDTSTFNYLIVEPSA